MATLSPQMLGQLSNMLQQAGLAGDSQPQSQPGILSQSPSSIPETGAGSQYSYYNPANSIVLDDENPANHPLSAPDAANPALYGTPPQGQASRPELASVMALQQTGLDSFIKTLLNSADDGTAELDAVKQGRLKYIKDETARGNINPQTPEEVQSLLKQPGFKEGQYRPLAPAAESKIQDELIAAQDSRTSLQDLADNFDPSFYKYMGQGKAYVSARAEKAGAKLPADQKEFLSKYTAYTQGVERFFNAYRKLITGSAAAVAELEKLKQSVINNELSPTQFLASLQKLRENTERTIDDRSKVLQRGIDISGARPVSPAATQAPQAVDMGAEYNKMMQAMEILNKGMK